MLEANVNFFYGNWEKRALTCRSPKEQIDE